MNSKNGLLRSARVALALVIALAVFFGSSAAPAQARAEVYKDHYDFWVEWYDFIPCADGGAGESVYVTGTFYVKSRWTVDDRGGVHGTYHLNSKGLQAVGLTTGDVYKAKQVEHSQYNSRLGFNNTYQYKLKFVGPGPGNNVMAQYRFHITVNAQGEVTAYIDDWSYTCN